MSDSSTRRAALLGVVGLGLVLAIIGLRLGAIGPAARGMEVGTGDAGAEAPTPELAARTVDRLQLFRDGSGGSRLSLSAEEVTAVLRHALPGVLPAGVGEPSIRLDGGTVVVQARIVTSDFVGRAPLASVLGALPDTVDVDLRGQVATRHDRLVFDVETAHAGRVPLPRAAVAAIASALAEEVDEPALATDTDGTSLSVRWPEELALVAVLEGRLILDRDEPTADRAVDGSDEP